MTDLSRSAVTTAMGGKLTLDFPPLTWPSHTGYLDGQLVHVGDTVIVPGGFGGIVVANLDLGEFSDEYSRADWEYLKSGVLVETQEGGLLHVDVADLKAKPSS